MNIELSAREIQPLRHTLPGVAAHGRQARVAPSGGHVGRAAHTHHPLPPPGARVRAVDTGRTAIRMADWNSAARSTSVLLRHLTMTRATSSRRP